MQIEFPFAQPFNDAVEAAEAARIKADKEYWASFIRMTDKMFPKARDFDWKTLFNDDVQPMNTSNKEMLSIPMTIVVGERNQFIFPFMREIYEKYWDFPVKFHSETYP